MFRWPERGQVLAAFRAWAEDLLRKRQDVVRVGCFGSYAAGRAGVGSDLDLVVVLASCDAPAHRRGLDIDTASLPVPCDLLVYTASELQETLARQDRFARELAERALWVPPLEGAAGR